MQWTSITKTDCTIHSIVIYLALVVQTSDSAIQRLNNWGLVDRVIHPLNNWAQTFSRPGSIKSSTPKFKNKTVNWSLRQEEWRQKINTENKNKVVLTVLLETRPVLLLHVFHVTPPRWPGHLERIYRARARKAPSKKSSWRMRRQVLFPR